MESLQDVRLQAIAAEFLERIENWTVSQDAFDAAYEWMSEQIPDFAEFEQVCMALGLA